MFRFILRVTVDSRESQAALILILAAFVCVTGRANAIGLEKQHLCNAFVGINLCWEGSGIGNFNRDLAAPFRLERCDVDNNSAARIGGLADADG